MKSRSSTRCSEDPGRSGVVSAGAAAFAPAEVRDPAATFYWLDGQPRDRINGQVALMRVVTRVPTTMGSACAKDVSSTTRPIGALMRPAVVNETFATRLPGRSAIGARFKCGQLNEKGLLVPSSAS